MIKVGLVDFDTSHVKAFTQRLNHIDVEEEQWVDGALVVAGWPGESKHSPDRVAGFTEQLKEYGIEIVDNLEDLVGKVDAVCIEANDGSIHLQRARPFLEAGIPCFVDKPFEVSLDNAREIFRLAEANSVPVLSTSSLRFCPEVQETLSNPEVGKILGASVHAPASEHPLNPGLFNYGIHGVEVLYTLMDRGCKRVSCAYTEGAEVVTGMWEDDRIGVMRGIRTGGFSYGFTVWGEKGICQSPVSTEYIYRDMLKEIVGMFQSGQSPIDPQVTLEIVAFMAGALESREKDGAWVELAL